MPSLRAVLTEILLVFLRWNQERVVDKVSAKDDPRRVRIGQNDRKNMQNFKIISEQLKGKFAPYRNICERRSCMKNNGESPTFKFVSGEERRPSEV